MTKKLISSLLLLALCVCAFASCGKEDEVPEGMYDVTLEGEPFILYVPGSWTDNRDSGMSSAYYSINNAVTVSARYYTPENADVTLDEYINGRAESYSASYENFKPVDRNAKSLLGEKTATRYEFTFDRVSGNTSTNITVVQYYAQHKGDIIMLNIYYATEKYTQEYGEMFEQIRSEFRFRDKKVVNGGETDKKTPAGMKIASFDGCEYVFYVPKSWVVNASDKLSEAYYPESSKPNVTVTSFAPDGKMTAKEYFTACQEIYKEDISGYELIGESERKLSGKDAVSYEYKAVYGNAEYRIMQTVAVYNDLIYSVTYTALADRYEEHKADVVKMLDAFRFR